MIRRLPVRRTIAGVSLMIGTTAVGAGILLLAVGSDDSGSRATASTRSPQPSARLRYNEPFLVTATGHGQSSTGTPTSTPAPDPSAGGDQASGPPPAGYGTIAENVNASPEFLALKDALEQSIVAYSDSVGGVDVAVAVTDLQNGESISVGGNVLHRTGCVINLFALLAAVSEFQAGNASPAGLGYSIKKGIGGSYPPEVKNFTQKVFGDYSTGTYHARNLMSSWGMTASRFDHIPYYGGSYPAPNILTALETNDILAKLWNEQLFNYEWTVYTLGVLRDSFAYTNYILPKRLPAAATVGHKIGYYADWDGWVNNDAGIVSFKGADGTLKAYAITYMSQMAGSEYIGYSFGAKLSRDVWDFMAGKYGVWAPPPPPSTLEPTPPPTPAPTDTPAPTPSPSPALTATPTPGP